MLAPWQRLLLWVAWLGVVALIFANSDRGSFTWKEAGAIAAAIALTVFLNTHPSGRVRMDWDSDAAKLHGEFFISPNWAMILLSAFVLLGGIAMCFKIANDRPTFSEFMADIVEFFRQWMIEKLTGGRRGDVTHSRLYILIVLIPIGGLMLWYNLRSYFWKSVNAFRIEEHGRLISVRRGDAWEPIDLSTYQTVSANGSTIVFKGASGELILPQDRVWGRALEQLVPDKVIGKFFEEQLKQHGFVVTLATNHVGEWNAVRS